MERNFQARDQQKQRPGDRREHGMSGLWDACRVTSSKAHSVWWGSEEELTLKNDS